MPTQTLAGLTRIGVTSVWHGTSSLSPRNSHMHTQPGRFGRESKKAFPPVYESPIGPRNVLHGPVEVKTIAKTSPADRNTDSDSAIVLNVAPANGRLDAETLSDVNTTPFGLSSSTAWISTFNVPVAPHNTGSRTAVRNPETPAVTTCASFCSLDPPIARLPVDGEESMINCR